jgi:hypothetical protein
MYEDRISERWSGIFLGEPLPTRTVTRIRELAELYDKYAKDKKDKGYDFVIMDTSPNLGALNKVIVSTADGFIIPCLPDVFSLYGIKNIGKALTKWQREFSVCYSILSEEKRKKFPKKFVQFLGYVIYNAKVKQKPDRDQSPWGLSQWGIPKAQYNQAKKIPETIREHITEDVRKHLSMGMLETPIGENAIIHTHNTFPNTAQEYHYPMWKLPDELLSNIPIGDRGHYKETRKNYKVFATDFLERVKKLDDE